MKLNGLCKYSFFDKTYQIQYDPINIISYVGIEKSIISFDFDRKVWEIRDVTNPSVSAVSEASFRSMAVGNFKWNIINDTGIFQKLMTLIINHSECSQESYSTVLSLTSCSENEFTCNNGLCIDIDRR